MLDDVIKASNNGRYRGIKLQPQDPYLFGVGAIPQTMKDIL